MMMATVMLLVMDGDYDGGNGGGSCGGSGGRCLTLVGMIMKYGVVVVYLVDVMVVHISWWWFTRSYWKR